MAAEPVRKWWCMEGDTGEVILRFLWSQWHRALEVNVLPGNDYSGNPEYPGNYTLRFDL